jgi:TIR domain
VQRVSDVFISYARSSETEARRIAEALRAVGFTVWRDDELPPHRGYADVIEERLRLAKAVVVVWSADAVKSQWVRAEADVAPQRSHARAAFSGRSGSAAAVQSDPVCRHAGLVRRCERSRMDPSGGKYPRSREQRGGLEAGPADAE